MASTTDENVHMMTAPAPTPAYQDDNVAKLQRVSKPTFADISALLLQYFCVLCC